MILDNYSQQQILKTPNQSQSSKQSKPPLYENRNIEKMNKVLMEKEQNNKLLEEQLQALKEGKIPSGPDGLAAIMQFEQLLQAIPEIENQVLEGKSNKKQQNKPTVNKHDKMVNPIKFSQNLPRSHQLDRGERTLINLQAQEYDQLRMISSFNPDLQEDDLYKFKMNQYKELSAIRNEQLKEINAQQIAKIRGNFVSKGIQQELEIKSKEMNDYVERMRIVKQIQAIQQMPQQQQKGEYSSIRTDEEMSNGVQQMTRPDISRGTVKTGQDIRATTQKSSKFQTGMTSVNDKDYDPLEGLEIYFDYVTKLYDVYNTLKFVYSVYNINDQQIDPVQSQVFYAQVDPTDNNMNAVIFGSSNIIRGLKPHPMSNLIIEMQVQRNPNDKTYFVSYGWTLINLFDLQREMNQGLWRLPLYQSPVQPHLDMRDINLLRLVPQTQLCMRIANARRQFDQHVKQHDHQEGEHPEEYIVPPTHETSNFFKANNEPTKVDDVEEVKENIDEDIEEEADDLKYNGSGLIVKIEQINHYVPSSSTYVTATLFQGDTMVQTFDESDCQFLSQIKDYNNVRDLPKVQKNILDKAYGRTLRINDSVRWDQNFYKLCRDDKKNDMLLVFEIYEQWIDGLDLDADNKSEQSKRDLMKQFTQFDIDQQKKLHGYAIMKLNNDDSTIKYGVFELGVFKPPINMRKRLQKDLIKQEQIKISLLLPDDENSQDLDESFERRNKNENEEEADRDARIAEIREIPYVDCRKIYYDSENLMRPGEGIDFYIDQLRYPPDNTTFTRLLIRGLTKQQAKVINAFKSFPEINDSTRMIQNFEFRMEIRPDTLIQKQPSLDPTTWLEIMIETIDRVDFNEKVIGFAYFPLFLTQDGINLPFDKTEENFIPNEGHYQLPIYTERITKEITQGNINLLSKIQCSTILVRAYKAPNGLNRLPLNLEDNSSLTVDQLQEKKIIRIPEDIYGKNVYNNASTFTERDEIHLYKFKHKRYNPLMNLVVGYIFNRKGIVARQNEETNKILQLLDGLFGKASLYKSKIPRKYENSYEPTYGFRLSLQRLHGLEQSQKTKLHFVVTQFIPPGRLLQAEPAMGPDVHVFKDMDIQQSKWNSVQFKEEMNYIGLPGKDKLGILIEVKAYEPRDRGIQIVESLGWAYLPLYQTVENENNTYSIFTNQGLIQLPLYGGSVEKSTLIASLKTEDPIAALQRDKDLPLLPKTSVIFRIHDNQNPNIPTSTDYNDLDTSLLSGKDQIKYYFNEAANAASTEKTIQELHNTVSEDTHNRAVKESFKLIYGFNYPKIT